MMTENVEVRIADADEVTELLHWAALEGWNPGTADAEAFRTADPHGFLGCFVGGRLAAGISVIRYGESFGFIGLYICQPQLRGRGLGLKVWQAGMERLADRTIGLDGVPAQQGNYAAMGFQPAYATARWSGRLQGPAIGGVEGVIPFSPDMLEAVMHYDKRFFPGPRGDFLKNWLSQPRRAFVVREGIHLRGYAVIRPCLQGAKLGPLFADSDEAAVRLLRACANVRQNGEIHLDVPEEQIPFTQVLSDAGFSRGFETARMYCGSAPDIEQKGVFAVSTLELG